MELQIIRTIRLENTAPVPDEYLEHFRVAELTFLHQKVFDVQRNKICPLIPFEASDIVSSELETISRSMGP
jgi:hypothetical protein